MAGESPAGWTGQDMTLDGEYSEFERLYDKVRPTYSAFVDKGIMRATLKFDLAEFAELTGKEGERFLGGVVNTLLAEVLFAMPKEIIKKWIYERENR